MHFPLWFQGGGECRLTDWEAEACPWIPHWPSQSKEWRDEAMTDGCGENIALQEIKKNIYIKTLALQTATMSNRLSIILWIKKQPLILILYLLNSSILKYIFWSISPSASARWSRRCECTAWLTSTLAAPGLISWLAGGCCCCHFPICFYGPFTSPWSVLLKGGAWNAVFFSQTLPFSPGPSRPMDPELWPKQETAAGSLACKQCHELRFHDPLELR